MQLTQSWIKLFCLLDQLFAHCLEDGTYWLAIGDQNHIKAKRRAARLLESGLGLGLGLGYHSITLELATTGPTITPL